MSVYQELNRSKDAKISKLPHRVEIGGEQMPVYPLVIRKEREFRHELGNRVSGIFDMDTSALSELNTATVMGIIDRVLGEDLLELVMLLVPELRSRDREWIDDHVATAELQHALWAGIQVNYPFVKAMTSMQILEFARQGAQERALRNQTRSSPDSTTSS